MLQLPTQSAVKKFPIKDKLYFTFWDMDDTAVALFNLKIKNPHISLLIWMFQAYAPDQLFGIMTSRPPSDEISPYTVSFLREECQEFGIEIPLEHVVFCGGENQTRHIEEERAIVVINRLLESLSIVEKSEDYDRKKQETIQFLSAFVPKKTGGKNHYLIEYLNKRIKDNQFHFAIGQCPQEALVLGLVDDMPANARAPALLGEAYFGVQASRGGNPPKTNDATDDFYSIEYLLELAKKIGFDNYVNSILKKPSKHKDDHPMLQVAALLFAWQQMPPGNQSDLIASLNKVEALMSPLQCAQIVEMLEYMKLYGSYHQQSGYRPVDDLLSIFRGKGDKPFLEDVLRKLSVIDNKLALLNPAVPVQEASPPAPERNKSFRSLLSRMPSIGKSASTAPTVTAPAAISSNSIADPNVRILLRLLEEKKQSLIDRITRLTFSSQADIAALAKMKLKSLNSRTSDEVTPPLSAVSSSSPSATTSARTSYAGSGHDDDGSDDEVNIKRRSFTPGSSAAIAAGRSSNSLRSVSSADSIDALEEKTKDKKLKTKSHSSKNSVKQKSGSSLN